MKLVRFTRDMRPYSRGGEALVPDEMAQQLVDEGSAEIVRPFGAPEAPAKKPLLSLPKRKHYHTK